MNFIRNEFDPLMVAVAGNIDILLIGETKIDFAFPESQFYLSGYDIPYRHACNPNVGGILVYVCDEYNLSIIKLSCKKRPPRMIKYKDYKKFSNEHFKYSLNKNIENQTKIV